MSAPRLRTDGLAWREIDGEMVAVDVRSSNYLGANPAGLLLWRALAEGATRDELVARLVEAFEVEPDRAGTDVDSFLSTLADRDLLEE